MSHEKRFNDVFGGSCRVFSSSGRVFVRVEQQAGLQDADEANERITA